VEENQTKRDTKGIDRRSLSKYIDPFL
jgi:hypothetical protein